VNVDLDYTKPAGTTADGRVLPEKHFYSVTEGKTNLALQLVERGLAKVVFHSDENRSPIYQSLVVAEKHAQTKGKGVWKSGKSEVHHVNDLTTKDGDKKGVDLKKAKQVCLHS
jgi:endonuclease YncB( thermonuclease family)